MKIKGWKSFKWTQKRARLLITLVLFAVLIVVFSGVNDSFLTGRNINLMLREAAPIGIIAVGMTFVIITGGIDLSVGSTLALVAMFCANMLRYNGVPAVPAVLLSLLLGTLCGFVNGYAITRLKLPDFIVALAAMNAYRGLTKLISHNDLESLSNSMIKDALFNRLGGKIGSVYIIVWLFFLAVVVGHIVLNHTKLGLYTFAVGSSEHSSKLSGVSYSKVKIFAYTLTGFLAGLAGVMIAARMMTATTVTGEGMEFNVIAAVVVGGTSLAGGRGSIVGSFLGAMMVTLINSGITQMGLPSSYQYIIKGGIILAAMLFDNWFFSRFSGTARRRTGEQEKAAPGGKESGADV